MEQLKRGEADPEKLLNRRNRMHCCYHGNKKGRFKTAATFLAVFFLTLFGLNLNLGSMHVGLAGLA